MAKYHISPATGKPNICRASSKPCPIGGEGDHYASKEEAQKAFENSMSKQTVVSKKVDGSAKEQALAEATPKWEELREIEENIDRANSEAKVALAHRSHYEKANEHLALALEADAKDVSEYKYGESNKRGTVNSYASSALNLLKRTEPYPPNSSYTQHFPTHEYKTLEDLEATILTKSSDNEMKLQELSDELDALEGARAELQEEVVAKTGFKENPRYGIPTGENTLEKYAGKPARNYSTNPTKDVAVLKDAKRFCTRCGDEVTYEKNTYRYLHSSGDTACDSSKVKAYSGKDPEYTVHAEVNPVCSYCGTGNPAHHSFKQQAYSDESNCSRCGGRSGYGIGD